MMAAMAIRALGRARRSTTRPETVETALAQILDIQQERALTYSLFDGYVVWRDRMS